MCKYTILPSSPGPTEHRVPLNPRILLIRLALLLGYMVDAFGVDRKAWVEVQVEHIGLTVFV